MFVLLFYFVSLRISMSQSGQTTENYKSPLKEQLQKSLTHVNDMLADIEGKIEQERKLLSQVDGSLRDKADYMEYDVTDIWWQPKENSTAPPRITINYPEGKLTTPTPQPDVTVPTISETEPTPTLFPQPPPIVPSTYPEGWPFSTTLGPQTAESLFIQEMKKTMVLDHHGYCTAFLAKLMELIATKDTANVTPLMTAMEASISKAIEEGKFNSMGNSLTSGMKMLLSMMTSLRPSVLQQQAGVAHYVLKHKKALMSQEMNSVLEYYDSLFNQAEGERLFAALEPFEKYPDGGKSADEVSEGILYALVGPLMRLEGTRQLKRLIQAVNEAIQDLYPNWRAQTLDLLENSYTPARNTNNISGDENFSPIPARRSMSYKKIVKHFLAKHPKFFKKLRRHHQLAKKNYRHHFTHKQRHHGYHKKNRDRRVRHGRYEPAVQRANTDSSKEAADGDTSESGAFYHESTTTITRAINTKKRNKLKRKRRDKILRKRLQEKQRQLRYLQEKRSQQKLLSKQRPTTKSINNFNPQYLKQLAINYFRQKQRGKNTKFRRFINSSSKEDNENNTRSYEYSEHSRENNILHKIREVSSYSDEEDHLRTNLYDALRHGNRTFVSFRASDTNNQTIWDMTSASDDEWVLKNNIYKVFDQ